jgi:hypothetical protein
VVTGETKGHLHFEFPDGSWLKSAFRYDFRLYTIMEIREAMMEAGFKRTHVWFADTTGPDPEHSGIFHYEKVEDGQRIDGCETWNGAFSVCPLL